MDCKVRGRLNSQDRVDGEILNWLLFHCGIPVWNHTLLLSIVEVNKQGGTYQKYSLMTVVEEMQKVPAMERGSISVGDGLQYKSVKSVIGTDCCRKVLRLNSS